MKTLNYEKIMEEAQACGVSVYTLIKRAILYRKAYYKEVLQRIVCQRCKNFKNVKFANKQESKYLCEVVGVMDDPHAEIKLNFKCAYYEYLK